MFGSDEEGTQVFDEEDGRWRRKRRYTVDVKDILIAPYQAEQKM